MRSKCAAAAAAPVGLLRHCCNVVFADSGSILGVYMGTWPQLFAELNSMSTFLGLELTEALTLSLTSAAHGTFISRGGKDKKVGKGQGIIRKINTRMAAGNSGVLCFGGVAVR